MPVKVKCTGCEKVLSVPDAARGKAVKCPACQTRIAIPAESEKTKSSAAKSEGAKSAAAKSKTKKPAKEADSEEALLSFDMRRAEDTAARICPKCGYDMKWQDEDDNECPKCGFDSSVGGMGAKAKKKSMKGPDPADFYPDLVSTAWKFVTKNMSIVARTIAYTLIALTIALGCAYLYLYISMWPPRIFLALCFTISFLVIPGWMWVLDVEVVKLVLERKEKFKRLNFDFFLSSAMGVASVALICVVVLPLLILPAAVAWFVARSSEGQPEIIYAACIGVGLIPVLSMLPIIMAHMTMPVITKGWMVWVIVPIWIQNIKPALYWLLWFLITNIPVIACLATVAVVYGPTIENTVTVMDQNAEINRQLFEAKENPNAKRKGQKAKVITAKPEDLQAVDLTPLIVPAVLLVVALVFNGFSSVFNMRTHAQFVYYNKNALDLVDKRKEYKYVAKKSEDDEDEELKPKTVSQMIVDSIAFFLIFALIGGIGGMLYGNLSGMGMFIGIVYGLDVGLTLAWLGLYQEHVRMAFKESPVWGLITIFGLYPIGFIVFIFQNFEERKAQLIRMIVGGFVTVFIVCLGIVLIVAGIVSAAASQAAPTLPPPMQNIKVDEEQPAKPADGAAQPAAAGDES